MEADTKREFEKLATMVADGFEQVDKRFEQVDKRFEQVDKRFDVMDEQLKELRSEIKSIRREIDELPDHIERIYGPTINDLLDRVVAIEKHLGIPHNA